MDADHNLLFGLLALQNGLIDQVQLVAAFQAWTRDRARPLGDHLVGRGDMDGEQRLGVLAMMGLHLKKHGDAGRSLAAMPAGPSTRDSLMALGDPDLEQTLTQLPSGSQSDADRTDSYAVGTASSDGQRFRVLRPHARGGLGAVFVALDGELHREVALKQILEKLADDPSSRARFLLEAEITGGLEHPGIVPVYGLGTYAGGRPFYAMRFIKGDSLKEAVDRFHGDAAIQREPGRRSLTLRKLLRRFIDVCNAIDYAHSRGVLHRDLKPGNIIVGKHGETLVVDWGLAKALGRDDPASDSDERRLVPSSASGSAETLPGCALGTPAYMSPEQAEGDIERLGPHSDVYSLGATLYYLLTGRPPAEGDVIDVLRAVRQGELRPPRQIAPEIDRALEAVCLKAMAHRPADRYPTPRALSDDVERWMADEPVSAWREPLSRRARRWARRNRTAVATVSAALLSGVLGLAAVLVIQTKAKADIALALGRETTANAALAQSNNELSSSKADVQGRYELAVEAIRAFHTGVSEDFLLKEEKFKSLRDRLLKTASDFYGKLAALLGRETDTTSRRALAGANFELAMLTGMVGRQESALEAHRSVLAMRRVLATEAGAGPLALAEVGRSLTRVATLLESTGKTDEAIKTYREAESLLAAPPMESTEARSALADCRSRLGWLLSSTGKHDEALAALRLARADQEALAANFGASNEARRDLADTLVWIGVLLANSGRPGEAEPEYGRAVAIFQKLAEENPASVDFASGLASTHGNLGILLEKNGRPREAEAEYRAAMSIFRKLADENPAVADFRNRLAVIGINLGSLMMQTGRLKEAEGELRGALTLFQDLIKDHPAVSKFRKALAACHVNLGGVLANTGRTAEAEAEFRAALDIQRKLAEAEPGNPRLRRDLGRSLNNLANLSTDAGRLGAAADRFRESVALHERLAEGYPTVTDYRYGVAFALTGLGRALHRAGRPGEAHGPLRRAVALEESIPNLSLESRFELARGLALLASAAADLRLGPGATTAASDRAMDALRQAFAAGYRNDLAQVRADQDLAVLRGRADFLLLMMDLAMPDDPFARAGGPSR